MKHSNKSEPVIRNLSPQALEAQIKAKAASKTKYTCPECGQRAWGKPAILLLCGICYHDGAGEPVLMLAE